MEGDAGNVDKREGFSTAKTVTGGVLRAAAGPFLVTRETKTFFPGCILISVRILAKICT